MNQYCGVCGRVGHDAGPACSWVLDIFRHHFENLAKARQLRNNNQGNQQNRNNQNMGPRLPAQPPMRYPTATSSAPRPTVPQQSTFPNFGQNGGFQNQRPPFNNPGTVMILEFDGPQVVDTPFTQHVPASAEQYLETGGGDILQETSQHAQDPGQQCPSSAQNYEQSEGSHQGN